MRNGTIFDDSLHALLFYTTQFSFLRIVAVRLQCVLFNRNFIFGRIKRNENLKFNVEVSNPLFLAHKKHTEAAA